jgi:hypothetical protein
MATRRSIVAKKSEAKRSYKLDIMTVLEAADLGKKDFYLNLTEEERKSVVPKVLIRWLSAVADRNPAQQYSILAVNDLVNLGLWNLSKHPELVWHLMCVAGTGRKQYHQWIATAKSNSGSPKLNSLIEEVWPRANDLEQDILKQNFSSDQWLDLAKNVGWNDRNIKDLKNELAKARTDQNN